MEMKRVAENPSHQDYMDGYCLIVLAEFVFAVSQLPTYRSPASRLVERNMKQKKVKQFRTCVAGYGCFCSCLCTEAVLFLWCFSCLLLPCFECTDQVCSYSHCI